MKSYAEIAKECRCRVEDVKACMAEARRIEIVSTRAGNVETVEITTRWLVPTDASACNAEDSELVPYCGAEAGTKTEAVEIALKSGWRPDRVNA